MRIEKQIGQRILVTIKDVKTQKSKSITVYDCAINKMLEAIKSIVAKDE
jgi:hypothetical protein